MKHQSMRELPEPAAPARIFVVGCARSGTTIAQKVISDAIGALTVPETNFFPALYGDAAFRQFGRKSFRHTLSGVHAALDITWPRGRHTRRSLDTLAAEVRVPWHGSRFRASACVEEFIAILDAAAQQAGAAAWLEKSPNHLYYIDRIEQRVENARFVHVLRDGVDTVASLVDAGRRYAGNGNDFTPDVAMNVARWNQAMRWHRQCAGRPGHVLVRLEKLAQYDWPAMLAVTPAGPAPRSAGISREYEVWKAAAVSGSLVAQDDKRHLLGSVVIDRIRRDLLNGGDISGLFPALGRE